MGSRFRAFFPTNLKTGLEPVMYNRSKEGGGGGRGIYVTMDS